MPSSLRVPQAMQAKFDEIVALIEPVCTEHLDKEYLDLCLQLTAKLARKRPSPLTSGRAKSWAASITYAIGRVNFLFDKSGDPYMSAGDLCKAFGVGKGTAAGRATQIEKMCNIKMLDPEWTRPSMMDHNPRAWFVMIDGLIMDARSLPVSVQRRLCEMGLIPYVPADQ